jgi:hypothetical protein
LRFERNIFHMFACLHVVYRRQSSLPYYMIQSSYYIQRSQISSSFVDTELRVFLPYFVHSSREVSTEHGATKQASKLRDDWNRRPRRKGGKRHSRTPPRRRLSAFDSQEEGPCIHRIAGNACTKGSITIFCGCHLGVFVLVQGRGKLEPGSNIYLAH